ncbi:MAG: DNA replication/repair protein RecF [Candidatus Kapaibacterium sp.]
MLVEKLRLLNFRNHTKTELTLSPGLNIFHGLNGSGKTSVLEALAYCAFSKSFLQVPDSSLVRIGESGLYVKTEALSDSGISYKVSLKYKPGSKKEISSTLGDNLTPRDIIGELPMVVLSPDYKSITFGSPQDRRSFLDRILSQAWRRYMEDLIIVKKCLKQRNNLLSIAKKERHFDFSLIHPWTNELIKSGAAVVVRRYKFIEEFKPYFEEAYDYMSDGRERTGLEYSPDSLEALRSDELSLTEKIEARYRQIAIDHIDDEVRRGTTLFGPQKDELKIFVNKGIARDYASQGQHKTLLISMKIAEFNYLKNKKKETPVIILDDIFSELDLRRREKVLELMGRNNAQTFITMTHAGNLKKVLPGSIEHRFFRVDSGTVSIDKGGD